MRTARQVRAVGDERHHSERSALGDSLLREAKEANVEVVERLFLYPVLAVEACLTDLLALAVALEAFVVVDEILLFVHRYAGEPVVRRVAEDDDDLRVAL